MPWPRASRGDSDSDDLTRSAPKPSTYQRAPTILRVQSSGVQPSPSTHAPANASGSAPRPGTSANAGDSGAIPESTTPITTPAPPRRRGLAAAPRTAASDGRPASGRIESTSIEVTSGWSSRVASWSAVSRAANPFSAVVQR